jgi:hypothetical protein
MNLQSLVVVLLCLVSLNLFLQVANQIALLIEKFISYRHHEGTGSLLVLMWGVALALIVGAILVWVFAIPIARLVTRGLPGELSLGSLSLSDCYSVMFIALGLYMIATHIAPALNWAHYLLRIAISRPDKSWQQEVQWYDVSGTVIPFIVGIILFVNGRKWAVALAQRHTVAAHASISPPPDPKIDT